MKFFSKLLVVTVLGSVVAINIVAFMQARAMTRFVEGGERTARPEQLGLMDKLGVVVAGVNVPRPRNGNTPAQFALPFTTHRIPANDGAVLDAWHIAGKDNRPLILMFHGYAVSKSTLVSTARVFHALGASALLVDFYGSGDSSGSGTTIGVKEADDVAAVVNYAKRAWPDRRLVLYGMSMGGAAVLRAVAANGVQPDGVIIEAVFDSLLNTGRNRFRAMGLPSWPLAELLLFWGSVQKRFNFFAHNPADYARAVRCPTLILHGDKDARVSAAEAGRIAESMGARAKFVLFAGVPHTPIVAATPGKWRETVGEFLVQF
ncbi:MAG: alpha/beta fold hydrolase [Deltaproteobacteria bacterium]|nr:alpha/beta fold hydrolase [Deltaproteobacteria bacterium]